MRSTTPQSRPNPRDYDGFWQACYDKARGEGMTDDGARFVANTEAHDRMLADHGLTPIGAGDLELMY